jgi:hypothetical protein
VTPIHLDLTGRRLMRQLQTWNWSLEDGAVAAARDADAMVRGASTVAEQERIAEDAKLERR